MAIKSEISWKRHDEDGTRMEVYARRFGGEWTFYQRERRHDLWQEIKSPSLDDWQTLLDAVQRRVSRRLLHPQDVQKIRQFIQERFPEADLDARSSARAADED